MKLSEAVAASSSVPVIFSPLKIPYRVNNKWETASIADGGLIDNLGFLPFWDKGAVRILFESNAVT
jgi:predicted acylesterase/phospholipase RssA